jgi:ABC-type glycerol-3-phosphate transport system permease component
VRCYEWHEDSPWLIHAGCVDCVCHFFCLIIPQHKVTYWGVSTTLSSICHGNCRQTLVSWLQTLCWLYLLRIQLLLVQNTLYCTVIESFCRRNLMSAGWWAAVCNNQHIILFQCIMSSTADLWMQHECIFLSDYDALFQTSLCLGCLQSRYLCRYSLNAARGFQSQKQYTKCISEKCTFVNLCIFVVTTVLVTSTVVQVFFSAVCYYNFSHRAPFKWSQ